MINIFELCVAYSLRMCWLSLSQYDQTTATPASTEERRLAVTRPLLISRTMLDT